MSESKPLNLYGVFAVLLGVTFVLYGKTFSNPWILDDFPVIVNNPDVTSLKAFWSDAYPGRPLRELTFLLDYTLFGMKPMWWHLQHLFWHGLNAFLLFCLVLRVDCGRGVAWLAALVFLAHPLQVEVVANISHRKDSLALAFSLLCLLAYAEIFRAGRRKVVWFLLAVALAFVAYTGKQVAVALPVICLAYEFAFVPKGERFLLARPRYFILFSAGVLCLIAALCIQNLDFFSRRYVGIESILAKMNIYPPFTERVYYLMAFKGVAFMLGRVIVPLGLAPEYVYPLPSGFADPWVLGAILLVAGTLVVLPFLFRRLPRPFFFVVWSVLFWLFTCNLIWPLSYFAADRYLYAPMAGFAVLFALCVRSLSRKRALFVTLSALAVIGLICATWSQNTIWLSKEDLWEHAVHVSPSSTTALNNLGQIRSDEKRYDEAIVYFRRAAELNTSVTSPRYNLAYVYDKTGQSALAIYYAREYLLRVANSRNPTDMKRASIIRRYFKQKYNLAL